MIRFLYHDGIQKEIAVLERRFRTIRDGLVVFERLCEKQFNPIDPQQVIAPAKLHRVLQTEVLVLWKIELVLPNSGLRPNQWPRLWFGIKGNVIVFLCLSSHVDNYNEEKMNRLAQSRISDLF
jgi:hypothetical protein